MQLPPFAWNRDILANAIESAAAGGAYLRQWNQDDGDHLDRARSHCPLRKRAKIPAR